ncbi:MAG TPA: hypothetical protein VMB26_18215 [Candidatus Binataceae bacterium]|nr:hypothetical protein [Candidatus Binataceae bacterium]
MVAVAVVVGVAVRVAVTVKVAVGVPVAVAEGVGVLVVVGVLVGVGGTTPIPASSTPSVACRDLIVNAPDCGPGLNGLKLTDALHWALTASVLGQLSVNVKGPSWPEITRLVTVFGPAFLIVTNADELVWPSMTRPKLIEVGETTSSVAAVARLAYANEERMTKRIILLRIVYDSFCLEIIGERRSQSDLNTMS